MFGHRASILNTAQRLAKRANDSGVMSGMTPESNMIPPVFATGPG